MERKRQSCKRIEHKQNKKSRTLFAIFLLVSVIIVVVFISSRYPMDYEMHTNKNITYDKGIVNRIISENLDMEEETDRMLGCQILEVKMQGGKYEGQLVAVNNNLSTTHYVPVEEGDAIIVKVDAPKGTSPYLTVYNYDRSGSILTAFVIFTLLMIVVGRRKGIGSVIGLLISLFFLMYMLLPMLYHGFSPILSSLVTAGFIAATCMILLNGASSKTGISLVSIMSGLVISVGTYFIIAGLLSVSGYQLEESENLLLISQHTGLDVGQLLFSCVVISSLGALMDMSMSLVSSLCEMKQVYPEITRKELIQSGMHVGGDMVGTMCETLILAVTGNALPFFLILSSYGVKLHQLLSSNYLTVEIMQGITGGISVVLSVPITVGVTAVWITRKS